ncbi:MAG: alpha-L-fucosidase, partial [Victivallales bacterium]|nr:alpha-L-fucosidase [Victivallales bacterium]
MDFRFHDQRDWFFQARLGMFVHWGIYSVEGWHEQLQWRRAVPKAEYVRLAERFNPVRFNPDEWL